MTAPNKTINRFHYGETVEVTLNCKNRDGTDLSTPDSQVVTMTIGATEASAALVTVTASQPTGGLATYLYQITSADYDGILTEGKRYYYNAWSTLGVADPILQAHGRITFQPSI